MRANSKAPPRPVVPPPPTATWNESKRTRPRQQTAENDYKSYVGVLRSEYEQLARNVDRWNEKQSRKCETKRDSPDNKTSKVKHISPNTSDDSIRPERNTPTTSLGNRTRIKPEDAKSKTPENISQWTNTPPSTIKLPDRTMTNDMSVFGVASVSPRIDIESLKPTKVIRQGHASWNMHTHSVASNNPKFVNRLIPLPPLEDARSTTGKRPERSPREMDASNSAVAIKNDIRPGKRSERSPRKDIAVNLSEHDRKCDPVAPSKKRQTQSDVRNIFSVPRIPRRSFRNFSRLKPLPGRYSISRVHGRVRWSPYRCLPRISGKRHANGYLSSQYSAGDRSLPYVTEVPKIRTLLETRLEKLWFGAKMKFITLSGKRREN